MSGSPTRATRAKQLGQSLSRSLGRSSRPEMFFKKGVIRNFVKFIGKYLC